MPHYNTITLSNRNDERRGSPPGGARLPYAASTRLSSVALRTHARLLAKEWDETAVLRDPPVAPRGILHDSVQRICRIRGSEQQVVMRGRPAVQQRQGGEVVTSFRCIFWLSALSLSVFAVWGFVGYLLRRCVVISCPTARFNFSPSCVVFIPSVSWTYRKGLYAFFLWTVSGELNNMVGYRAAFCSTCMIFVVSSCTLCCISCFRLT